MLPAVLSGDVCSLLGQVDRYAVSVLWELDPESHKVISVWYGRTVIRSSFKLFYEAAQDVIDGVKTPREVQAAIPELQAGPHEVEAKTSVVMESSVLNNVTVFTYRACRSSASPRGTAC